MNSGTGTVNEHGTVDTRGTVRTAAVGFAMALGIVACTASTKMLHSTLSPDFQPGTVKKVFVVGVAQNEGLRKMYEDDFVANLKSSKYDGEASYNRIPDPDPQKVDKDAVAAALVKDGFTHVLVTRLVSVDQRETYVPPSTMAVGVGYGGYPGYYGGWYPYMSMSYSYVTSPGYVTVDKGISLETNLYDLSTQKMVYSGMTQTWVDSTPAEHVREVIYAVVWDLRSKKVL
jgi:hypothetical protein